MLPRTSFPRIVFRITQFLLPILLPAWLAAATLPPITIKADRMTLDQTTGKATYRGQVVVMQGDTRLMADEVILTLENRQITRLIASGKPARFEQHDTRHATAQAQANHLEYWPENQQLLLQQQARLVQEGKVFEGEEIRYDIARRKINAEGNEQQRVKLIIPSVPAKSANHPESTE